MPVAFQIFILTIYTYKIDVICLPRCHSTICLSIYIQGKYLQSAYIWAQL